MTLLSARSTSVAYPADAALRTKRLYDRHLPKGAPVKVQLAASGTLTGTWEAGVTFSVNEGVTWNSGFLTVSDGQVTPSFEIPNGALVGPTFAIGSGSPVISLQLLGGSR